MQIADLLLMKASASFTSERRRSLVWGRELLLNDASELGEPGLNLDDIKEVPLC